MCLPKEPCVGNPTYAVHAQSSPWNKNKPIVLTTLVVTQFQTHSNYLNFLQQILVVVKVLVLLIKF